MITLTTKTIMTKTDNNEKNVLVVEGTIAKRRSLGQNLAFCDVVLLPQNNNKNSSNNMNNCTDEQQQKQQQEEAEVEEAEVRIQLFSIIFARHDGWDGGNNFPVKPSLLPFGAHVRIHVIGKQQQSCVSTPSSSLVTLKTTTSTLLCTVPSPKHKQYNVVRWELLNDPRKDAEELARIRNDTLGGSSGISLSLYRKERARQHQSSQVVERGKIMVQQNKVPRTFKIHNQTVESETINGNSRFCCTISADDVHSNAPGKGARARVFAAWLISHYHHTLCSAGGVVWDIAGGKGQLAIELAVHGITCIVIDPLLRKKFLSKRSIKRIGPNNPLPKHEARIFSSTTTTDCVESTDNIATMKNVVCLLGLHPDEATEDIVDEALKYNKALAVVPCCVFPTFFTTRLLRNGTLVHSYEDFVSYLLEKDQRLQHDTLPFQGRNQVIYYFPNNKETSIMTNNT